MVRLDAVPIPCQMNCCTGCMSLDLFTSQSLIDQHMQNPDFNLVTVETNVIKGEEHIGFCNHTSIPSDPTTH